MKFRTKLFYSFISLGLISTLLALFIIYGEASHLIFETMRSKILSIVINSDQLLNIEEVESLVIEKGNQNSASYQSVRKKLVNLRNINRRSDVYIKNVYLLKQYTHSNHYYFILDINKSGEDIQSNYGKPYPTKIKIPQNINKPFVNTNIYSDEWGTWLSGYAPIFDHNGNRIAVLGIDVRTKEIYLELEKLLLYGLIAFGISIGVAIVFAYILSKLVSLSLVVLCNTVKKIGKGDFSLRSQLQTRDEFNELSIAINTMLKGLEERERLKIGFARYVSQYALEELLKLDKPISLEGERKKVTLLFSDIRHFTSMAEELPPEKVLKILNEYFEEMIDVIFRYGGTLDKFLGDGIMVEFGAPLEDKFQELHAVLAAIHMQFHLDKLCDKWEKEGNPRLEVGVGIHTGLAVLGNIGSEKRMEYTAIGDTVNVASKLEGFSKKVNKPIVISHAVYEKVKDYFVFEDLKELEIAGRKRVIRGYSIDPHQQKDLYRAESIGREKHDETE